MSVAPCMNLITHIKTKRHKIIVKLGERIFNPFVLNLSVQCIQSRKGLFRCKVFLYRAYILEQSLLDEMKGI